MQVGHLETFEAILATNIGVFTSELLRTLLETHDRCLRVNADGMCLALIEGINSNYPGIDRTSIGIFSV